MDSETLSEPLSQCGQSRTAVIYRWIYFIRNKVSIQGDYRTVSWLFLRVLALIYTAAFASMAVQILGLVGSNGILPIASHLSLLHETLGNQAYWLYPTLFWLDASDTALVATCVAGILSGLAVLFDILTRWALIACYVLYLSVVSAGQDFTSFQWDMFLLESGFLAIFLCSGSKIIVFLYRWLLFRFMFLGGLVKVASGDESWANLTALTYHYETQPLPSPLAWYAHHLPFWVHKMSVVGVFAIELVVPFFVFLPKTFRVVAAWSFILLQGSIIATGNYNFFNLLTIALCLFLVDDKSITGLLGPGIVRNIQASAPNPRRAATMAATVLVLVVFLSNATMAWMSNFRKPPSDMLYALMRATLSFGIANNYGPFAVMTTRRHEIVIQGSMNGREWFPYEFKYKPESLKKQPAWIIPHQPRLDWQMWFAALRPDQPPFWFYRLIKGLYEAQPSVISLFQNVPFSGQKPVYLRAELYRYRFSSSSQRGASGQFWTREYLGAYWPPRR